MACDDWCKLKFGKTAGSTKDPETLLSVNSYSNGERYYYRNDGRKRITDWIDLVKGQNYYLETDTQNYNWDSSYTLSVEIQQTAIAKHHNAMKQIQKLSVGGESVLETTEMIITNKDDGKYRLVFKNPKTFARTITDEIKADASCSTLKNAINKYYRYNSEVKSWTDCTRTSLDAAGKETTSSKDTVSYKYRWNIRRHIDGKSTNGAVQVLKSTTKASIKINMPETIGKLSGKPMTGKFVVKCFDENGAYSESAPIPICSSDHTIERSIGEHCS